MVTLYIAGGLGCLFIFCAWAFVWYLANQDREETKRWQQRMETERKEREAEMEAMRLGYVQERFLKEDIPGDVFTQGFNAAHHIYGLRWVKPAKVENFAQNEAFKDLFDRMCREYGIGIGSDTWDEAVGKINRTRQEIRSVRRELDNLRQEVQHARDAQRAGGPVQSTEVAEAEPSA